MKIRKSEMSDLPRMMEIYARAREFMRSTGNPRQWAERNWPPESLIRSDIEAGRSYVCTDDGGTVIGTFYYFCGENIDPTYRVIEDGEWSRDTAYGVVHRIASDGTHGVGTFCLSWALRKSGYLRIDTHPDNRVMQNLLSKLGFQKRGIIHIQEDPYPRFAFDKSEN